MDIIQQISNTIIPKILSDHLNQSNESGLLSQFIAIFIGKVAGTEGLTLDETVNGASIIQSVFSEVTERDSLLSKLADAHGIDLDMTQSLIAKAAPLISGELNTLAGDESLQDMLSTHLPALAGFLPEWAAALLPAGLLSKLGTLGAGAAALSAGVASIGGKASDTLGIMANDTAGVVDTAAGAVGDAVSNVASGTADVVDAAAGAVGDVATGAVDAVGSVAGSAVDTGAAAVDKVSDVASGAVDVVDTAAGAVGDAVSNVASGTADVVDAAAGKVSDVATGAVGAVGSVAGSAVDAGAAAVDKVGDVASGAVDAVGNVASGAADVVDTAAGAVGDAVSNVASGAADAVDAAADKVSHVATGAVDAGAAAAASVAGAAGATAAAGGGLMKKLLPILGLIIAGFLAFSLLKSCNQPTAPVAVEDDHKTEEKAEAAETTDKKAEAEETAETPAAEPIATPAPADEASDETALKAAKFELTTKDGQIDKCSGTLGNDGLKDKIFAAVKSVFGDDSAEKCSAVVVDSGYQTNLENEDKLADAFAAIKDVDGANITVDGAKLMVNAATPEAAATLIDKLKNILSGYEILPFAGKLFDVDAAVKKGTEGATTALDKLDTSATAEDIANALNIQVINFATGKDEIPAENKAILDKAAKLLTGNANAKIDITGHTDSRGDAQANIELSERRAKAVLDYLVSQGASADQLTSKGVGSAEPVASEDTAEGLFKNRRISFSGVAK